MHGNDPNWGRIVSAAGMGPAAFEPQKAQLKLCATPVFRNGKPLAFNSHLVSEAMRSSKPLRSSSPALTVRLAASSI